MANITELIKNIRQAILGKEVRESIAGAIEQCYEDASKNGNANMEVTEARGSFDTLNQRLNNSDNVKAEKKEVEDEKEFRKDADDNLQTQINSLASGSPLVASSISEMTDTSRVYVNTTDGHWYYYNENNWIAGGVYQATEIGNREVGLKNLNFVLSDNTQLFNKENVTYDKYINSQGNLANVEDEYKYCVSDFIPVEEHHIYARTYNSAYWSRAFYDENKEFINMDFNGYKFSPVVAPLNAKYFRFSIRANTSEELKEILDSFIFNEGFIPNKHTPYYKDFDELTYFLNIDKFLTKQLDNSINIFNNKYYINAYIQTNGGLDEPVDGKIYYTTDLIECTQNDTIYSNQNMIYIGEWDENYNFLNRTNTNVTLIRDNFKPTNSQTKYIAITYSENDFDNNLLMITKNNKYDNYIPNYNINIPYKSITKNMLSDEIKNEFNSSYFANKTVNFLGDSITYGYDGSIPNNTNNTKVQKPYPETVKDILGLYKSNNYGVSGASISGGSYPLYLNYTSMTDNADYIVVFAGTNDWSGSIYGQPLGEKTDTEAGTFYGALDILIKGLVNKYPSKKIGFITPLKRTAGGETNKYDLHLSDYVDAIIYKCNEFAIPVLNLFLNSGCCPQIDSFKENNLPDGLHPNQQYYNVLGYKIAQFIKSL